jgi:hypothetical protein
MTAGTGVTALLPLPHAGEGWGEGSAVELDACVPPHRPSPQPSPACGRGGKTEAATTRLDDLRAERPEYIAEVCEALITCGCVLHGSNTKALLRHIAPRQANDAAKASGNACAVYASTDVFAVLLHAVFDRAYCLARLGSFTIGHARVQGRPRLRMTAKLFDLAAHGDARLASDGFVYALDGAAFAPSPDSADEFTATHSVTPLRILQVPAALWPYLLAQGSMPYDAADMRRLRP